MTKHKKVSKREENMKRNEKKQVGDIAYKFNFSFINIDFPSISIFCHTRK